MIGTPCDVRWVTPCVQKRKKLSFDRFPLYACNRVYQVFFFFCSASWVVADRRPTRVPLYCRRKEPKQEHYVGMPDDFEVETTVTYEILENIQ